MKLHLGCGTTRLPEYVNIDLYEPSADLQHDLTKPLPFADHSVDSIYSSHVIEHFSRLEWEQMRQDWARVIRPGGTIDIRCLDISLSCQLFLAADEASRWEWLIKTIYGWQGNDETGDQPGQFHKNGFTFEKLAADFPAFDIERLDSTSDYELHVLLTKHH
jgi:SAM-dependent methyltransferase